MNSQEYFDWLSKFEAKKTTDDCYTPPAVYDVVVDYVHNHVINLDSLEIVRPFYPNGDYTDLSQYSENSIVIDNPPFSLSAKIHNFYQKNHIKFFLFAPALSVFQSMNKTKGLTAIIAPHSIKYANGAIVPTTFITNTTPHLSVKTAPLLLNKLKETDNFDKPELPKYEYPKNILMVNKLQKLCKAGIEFEMPSNESQYLSKLESQRAYRKILFGGGLIISDNKAKELQAKELQAKGKYIIWELSDHERQIIDQLNKGGA